ncbi:MAG TPA: phage GP46 family protein [Pseudoxanthomonas sp.]
MADIALTFSDYSGGDLARAGQDLARDDGLESAVLVSLFSDRRATPEQIRPGDDPSDLRGWWGDFNPPVIGDQTGSLLWLLRREKQTSETLARARQYAEQALRWLLDDRVAKAIAVQTEYGAPGVMHIGVEITRPDASRVRYQYDYEWAAQAAKAA